MEQNNITYIDIIKDSNYRNLILARMIDRFGDSIDGLAFTWLVYQITHNAMWSAIVFALNMLPNVIVQPFARAFVEKKTKRKSLYLLSFSELPLFLLLHVCTGSVWLAHR